MSPASNVSRLDVKRQQFQLAWLQPGKQRHLSQKFDFIFQ
jgi:hypothetical protein